MIIIDNEILDLPTSTGPMRTHILRPAAPGRYPGIVLWSEIFQVTGPVKRTAALFAGNGFIVAVPEIYHEFEQPGIALAYDDAGSKRGNDLKTAKLLSAYDSDARAALDALKSHPHCTGKLGTAGICIGGHLAFRTAFNPDVLATTCFYPTDLHKHGLAQGMCDDSLDRAAEIRGELLMIWGRQDPHIPREGRRMVYEAISDAELNFQWAEFNGAHAFLRDEGPRYNPALAQLSYGLALELFKRKLNEGDLPAHAVEGGGETRH